jgi:hypothetical protein
MGNTTTIYIRQGEHGERTKPVELSADHFNAVNQFHYDNGLKASAIYCKDGKQLGLNRMDEWAADAMVEGMMSYPLIWRLDYESVDEYGYRVTYFTNLHNGVQVSIYGG